MQRRLRLFIPVVLVVLIVLALVTRGFGLAGPRAGGPLTLYGNVDIREVDLAFRVGGRIASITREEGEAVKSGEALAALETAPLAQRLAAADGALAAAEAEAAKRVAGSRPQDIAQAADQLAQRQATLTQARADAARRRPLVAGGAVSQAQLDQTEAVLKSAEAAEKAAADALSLARAGYRVEDIAAARAQAAQARALRDAARTDLDDAVLRAPADGVLLTRAQEPGAMAAPGQTIFTLALVHPVRVRAYVSEPDLSRVRPGMAVKVTADGAGRTYHGTIGAISPTAEFTPKTVETRSLRADLVYRVRIIVTDGDDGLRQGQPVTVTADSGARP